MFDTVNTFMDINELESFKLSDAVKFNKTLNPRLWGRDEHLLPEVREKLMAIADDFREFLGVDGLDIKDITVSGSNAAYTYTPHSDVDLHLVVEFPQGQDSEIYRELFDAKKYQYNDQHNYKIGGYDVELYVQDADQVHHSQGIYSVLNNDWVSVPRRRQPDVDDISVRSKFEDIGHRIEQAIASGDPEQMAAVAAKVKNMRQAGLDTTGEFGAENLAFKALRTQGVLDQLRTARNAVKDQELSLQERKKKKKRAQRGYGGYWYPGFTFGDGEGGDGGGESVRENTKSTDIKQVLQPFVDSCVEYLGIEQPPKIILKRDPEWTRRNGTFGRFDPETYSVTLAVSGRHILDILRTLAHELTHARQDEQADMPVDAGETGSPYEDEANAMAGRIMRHWVEQYPEFFKDIPLEEDYDPNGPPPGPETKPTMPAGTVRVDVSDTYDWYKLGQHISNLKGRGQHDFGKGPPSTIMSFGSEDEEHKYIDALKKTGLTTTDIDPVDVNQPPGMPRQKTDPTYNVDEAEVDETSLATMRDYFAGDDQARDPYEITKQRLHFAKDRNAKVTMQKRFNNPEEYQQWLKTKAGLQQKLKEASGYIPVNDKEAQDPRYSMAITVDIKPGEVQRQARKMGWKTDPAGNPPLLKSNASNLREFQESNMKIAHILKEATLGGFPVKVLNIQDQGVDEAYNNYHANRTGFSRGTRDPEGQDPQVSQQVWGLKINGKVWSKDGHAVTFASKEAALKARQSLLAKRPDLEIGLVTRGGVAEGTEKRCLQCGMKNCKCPGDSCKCKPIAGWIPGKGFKKAIEEAIKLNAPQRTIPRDELQGYADRIKSGTKTKRDKFAPIIHGSNIRAITKDDENTEWDLDDLSNQITTRPKAILGTNAKMEKSKTEGEIIYDLTLPALSGIVVDEETGDFVEITTCPGAGACQLFCYARKGGYVMFPASSMSAAQALNFLVNDPEGYTARVNQEIKSIKAKTDKAGVQLVVRWHDAGDFFSKEYLDLAYGVAKSNPDVQFYAYTKMGDVATGAAPANFTMNFSSGSKRGEEKKVEFYKQQNPGATVKQGVTVPKNLFFDLIARKGNSLIKDAKGRTQFASPEALDAFKQRLAQQYKVAPDSIITYDQMLAMPVGPTPKWNVIVQPGAGDRAANRKDVIDSYLMFH